MKNPNLEHRIFLKDRAVWAGNPNVKSTFAQGQAIGRNVYLAEDLAKSFALALTVAIAPAVALASAVAPALYDSANHEQLKLPL